jgi:hypothetical protein
VITEFTPSYDVYISKLIRFVRIYNTVSVCNLVITEFTPSYDVYISQLIRFVRICNNVSVCNLVITEITPSYDVYISQLIVLYVFVIMFLSAMVVIS